MDEFDFVMARLLHRTEGSFDELLIEHSKECDHIRLQIIKTIHEKNDKRVNTRDAFTSRTKEKMS